MKLLLRHSAPFNALRLRARHRTPATAYRRQLLRFHYRLPPLHRDRTASTCKSNLQVASHTCTVSCLVHHLLAASSCHPLQCQLRVADQPSPVIPCSSDRRCPGCEVRIVRGDPSLSSCENCKRVFHQLCPAHH